MGGGKISGSWKRMCHIKKGSLQLKRIWSSIASFLSLIHYICSQRLKPVTASVQASGCDEDFLSVCLEPDCKLTCKIQTTDFLWKIIAMLPSLGKQSINFNNSFINLHPDNFNFGPMSPCFISHVHRHSPSFFGLCFCRCASLEAKFTSQCLMCSPWNSWNLYCCLQLTKQYFGKFLQLYCF